MREAEFLQARRFFTKKLGVHLMLRYCIYLRRISHCSHLFLKPAFALQKQGRPGSVISCSAVWFRAPIESLAVGSHSRYICNLSQCFVDPILPARTRFPEVFEHIPIDAQ